MVKTLTRASCVSLLKSYFFWKYYSLGPLVTKVKEFQVETIVETLCSNMLSEKEQLKDISSIGLKTVINQLPSVSTQISTSIVKKITGRLLNTIQKVAIFKFHLVQLILTSNFNKKGRRNGSIGDIRYSF